MFRSSGMHIHRINIYIFLISQIAVFFSFANKSYIIYIYHRKYRKTYVIFTILHSFVCKLSYTSSTSKRTKYLSHQTIFPTLSGSQPLCDGFLHSIRPYVIGHIFFVFRE